MDDVDDWGEDTPVVDPWDPGEISAIIAAEEVSGNPLVPLMKEVNGLRKASDETLETFRSWHKSMDTLFDLLGQLIEERKKVGRP